MSIDVTIISVRPGTMARALTRLQEALAKDAGKLMAAWTTDVGTLNQIMLLRQYESSHQAAQSHAAHVTNENPYGIAEFVHSITSDTFAPLAFLPPLKVGTYGPFFEVRTYLLKAGVASSNAQRWEKALPKRTERSPLLIAMTSMSGLTTRFIHIWPYKSMDERHSVRSGAVKDGIWPPPGGGEATLLLQQNDIYVPTAFSPIK